MVSQSLALQLPNENSSNNNNSSPTYNSISTPVPALKGLSGVRVESLTKENFSEVCDPPPDGGLRAWLVVFCCFSFNFNLLGVGYAYGVYQAHYLLHQFPEGSAELISLIGSICTALTLTIGLPVGRLVENYGHRTVALAGSLLFGGSLAAAGFCRTIPTLLVTQGIFSGIGAGLLFIPANTAPAQWFLKRRALSIGLSSAGAGVGGIFWSFYIRTIIAKMGYQWALWTSACIASFINLTAVILLKTRPMPPNSRQGSVWSTLVMFKDPRFITLYCASALSVFGYMVPWFYVPTFAQTQLKSSSLVGSILSAVIDLGMAFGRITIGIVADSKFGTMNSVVVGMALGGLCQFALWIPSFKSLPLLYAFSFIYGFVGGGYIGLLPAVLAQIFDPDRLPTITGIFFTSELPGQLAGGPIAGAILGGVEGRWIPVIVYTGFSLFCGALFAAATRLQVERRIFVVV